MVLGIFRIVLRVALSCLAAVVGLGELGEVVMWIGSCLAIRCSWSKPGTSLLGFTKVST